MVVVGSRFQMSVDLEHHFREMPSKNLNLKTVLYLAKDTVIVSCPAEKPQITRLIEDDSPGQGDGVGQIIVKLEAFKGAVLSPAA